MRIGLLVSYTEEEINFLTRVGFKSCELIVSPGSALDPAVAKKRDIARAKDTLAERGIEVSAIGHYQNNLAPNQKQRKDAVAHLERLLDLCTMMDVGVMCTFAGRVPDLSIEDNIPHFKEVFAPLAKKAEDKGLKIGFENCPMFHHHPFRGINIAYTPRAWDFMFDAVPSPALGLEYDPSHLICLLIDPVEIIRAYGSKIVHVHAKDAEVDYSFVRMHGILEPGAVRHRTPGMGDVNWAKVVSALVEFGYKGNLDIEGRHDPIFGGALEEAGLIIGYKHLLHAIGEQV